MTEMMAVLFGGLFYLNPDQTYQQSFKVVYETNYDRSDIKVAVDKTTDNVKNIAPEAAFLVGTAYIIQRRREISFKTSKIMPIDNSETFVHLTRNSAEFRLSFTF